MQQVILSIIIAGFTAGAGIFFYNNSLRKRQQCIDTIKAGIKTAFYLPIFLQGFFLIYTGVTAAFFLISGIFKMLRQLTTGGESANASGVFLSMYFGTMLMAVNIWLAQNCLKKASITNCFFYFLYCCLMIDILWIKSLC